MYLGDVEEKYRSASDSYENIAIVSKGMRGYYSFTTDSTHNRYDVVRCIEMNENEKDIVDLLLLKGKKDIRLYNVRTNIAGYYLTAVAYNNK